MEPRGPRDLVHAACSSYAERRLRSLGWDVEREVAIIDGRVRGWIDLLAFDHRRGILLIIEVKTALDDIGRLERQIGWYERVANDLDVVRAWRPEVIQSWVLVTATAEVDAVLARDPGVLASAFPHRARVMREVLAGSMPQEGRGLALVDPRRRRADWLLPSRTDGRRSPAPYPNLAVARRLIEGHRG
jgi:hypothetical protein